MQIHTVSTLSPFVGRTRELADVVASLSNPECRLLTITGQGGSGKTRLALEAAEQTASQFAHGTAFVELQTLDKSDLIVTAIACVVGLSFFGEADSKTQLFSYLRTKSLLLVLDNFEHLLDGAMLVSELLAHAPDVKILVTSREALNLREEWLYPLMGMETPRSVHSTMPEDYEAVQLFLYHARRLQPDFDLADERETVIRICQIAEGLPLALELAASWLKGLSLAQIAGEMQRNLDILTTTARNVEERHRSIRVVFDQSWHLLTEAERLTFARLSVFRGGFDREAAGDIAGATLPLLVTLVEKSLIKKLPSGRWSVHELLRQYGEEKLESLDLSSITCTVHSHYYADFMRQCEAAFKTEAQLDVLNTIDSDSENVRAGWNWAVEHHDSVVIDQMLESLYHFGFVRSRFRESVDLFQRALDGDFVGPKLLGRLLVRRWGYFQWLSQENYQGALADLAEALEIATAAGDRCEIAIGKLMHGYALINLQDYAGAQSSLEDSLTIFHEIGEPYYESWVMHRIGYVCYHQGMGDQAMAWTERSLALARIAHNQVALSNCLYNLGVFYLMSGSYSKGESYCAEGLQIATSLRHQGQIAYATAQLGLAAFWRGDFDETRRLAEDAIRLGDEIYGGRFHANPLSLLALLACLRGDEDEAIRFAEMAEACPTNATGFQLYPWARAVLASNRGDAPAARQAIHDALELSLRERTRALQISLALPAAYALSATQPAQAVRLLGWVEHSSDEATLWAKQWSMADRLHDQLRKRLGMAAFDAECEQGAEMKWDSVLAILREEFLGAPEPANQTSALPELLTQREIDVLRLMAAGMTNSQIAECLVIGLGTVKTHALNIYRKLDVANRTQAILHAQELGLVSTDEYEKSTC